MGCGGHHGRFPLPRPLRQYLPRRRSPLCHLDALHRRLARPASAVAGCRQTPAAVLSTSPVLPLPGAWPYGNRRPPAQFHRLDFAGSAGGGVGVAAVWRWGNGRSRRPPSRPLPLRHPVQRHRLHRPPADVLAGRRLRSCRQKGSAP